MAYLNQDQSKTATKTNAITIFLLFVSFAANILAEPSGMQWVYIDEPVFKGYMSKYETTNAQYCQFLNSALNSGDVTVNGNGQVFGANGSNPGNDYVGQIYFETTTADNHSQIHFSNGSFTVRTRDNKSMNDHPVVFVTWYGAKAFCYYYGYSLPTASQWREAANYNGDYIYGCGTTISTSEANYDWENPIKLQDRPFTTPVGYYYAFGYGLCDMAGNLWEWTNTSSGNNKILCGGSWGAAPFRCKITYNDHIFAPDYATDGRGFRPCSVVSEYDISLAVREEDSCDGITDTSELNSLELWKNGQFVKRVNPTTNPYTFEGLDALEDYRIDAYINDMLVGYLDFEDLAGNEPGTICAGERVQIDVNVTDQSGDPSEGVSVELVSHENKAWRTGITGEDGKVDWVSPVDPEVMTDRAHVMPATLSGESWKVIAKKYGQVVGASDLLTKDTPDMQNGEILSVNINNLPVYGNCQVNITGFSSTLGLLKGQSMPANTWSLHIQPSGSVQTILDFEWDTDTPATIQGFATAYGPTGIQDVKPIYLQPFEVQGTGSEDYTFDSFNMLPGNEYTYELVITLSIYNGEYGENVPAFVDHAVISIPENLPLGYSPSYVNPASAKQDIVAIQNGTFTTDIPELTDIYEKYSTAYADLRRNIRQHAKEGIDSQIWDAVDVIAPDGLGTLGGLFLGRYNSLSGSIIDISKDIFSFAAGISTPGLCFYQLVPYVYDSYERKAEYEHMVVELQMYGYISEYISSYLNRPILDASDGEFPDKVVLSWSAVEQATSYKVFRAENEDLSDNTLIADNITECNYDDTTAVPATVYYYSIYTNVEDQYLWSEKDEGNARLDLDFNIYSSYSTADPNIGTHTYPAGSTVASGNINSPIEDGNSKYICTGYSGTGSAPTSSGTSYSSFVINEKSSITWQWKTEYMVTSSTSGNGCLIQNPVGWHDSGDSITFIAIPDNDNMVISWEVNGNVYKTHNNYKEVYVNSPTLLSVNFAEIIPGDIDKNCEVGINDLYLVCDQWLQYPDSPSADIAPKPRGDEMVNLLDFVLLSENWLKSVE